MKNLVIPLFIFLSLNAFSIDPKKDYEYTPESFKLEYRELKIKTKDNYELNTWVMQPFEDQHKNKTVVIVGSDAGNMGNVLGQAIYLMKSGYRVVTFDYRGFGDSTDFKFKRNNLYHSEYITDFVTIMDWCKKEYVSDEIGVLAYSMGTLISAIGYQQSKYDFYIGEAFLRNPKTVIERLFEHKGKDIHLPDSFLEDSEDVEKLNIPILLFAASNDKITVAEDCFDFCKSRKNASTKEYEGEHLRGIATIGMEGYFQIVSEFIDGY